MYLYKSFFTYFSGPTSGKELVDDLNKNVSSKSNSSDSGGGSSNNLTQLESPPSSLNSHTHHHHHHHHPATLANLDNHQQSNGPPSHRGLEVTIKL